MAVEVGCVDRLTEVHANLVVTADAKIAIGTRGYTVNRHLHRHVDRAQLRIGMLRHRPLIILFWMARRAGIGRTGTGLPKRHLHAPRLPFSPPRRLLPAAFRHHQKVNRSLFASSLSSPPNKPPPRESEFDSPPSRLPPRESELDPPPNKLSPESAGFSSPPSRLPPRALCRQRCAYQH